MHTISTGRSSAFGWRAPIDTRIAEPPAPRRAVSASQAVRELGYGASGERGKQITQVRLVRGTAQHGSELEDLFDRPQRRAVVIVDRVLVANLGLRREDHHADRPVLRVAGRGAAFALVPGDEDHATLLVGGGIENHWYVFGQPVVAVGDGAIVHVVSEVRRDEVVAGARVVRQVGG